MPRDPHALEDEDPTPEGQGQRFGEFDCPSCQANNPYDEPFGDGDEVRCFYCGDAFVAHVTGAGKLRLREI